MKKMVLIFLLVVAVGIALTHVYYSDRGRFTTEAEFTGLLRTVDGNDLVSINDPQATLRFGPEFNYLGGQKFILYGVADTEQYFFVETDAQNKLKSVYWVQYEAYLPGKPYTYNYDDSPLRLTLGEYEFFTDAEPFHFDPEKKRKRGTDGALVRQFLASKGYTYPAEVMYARMVYLTDASKQKELMIIYMDDLNRYEVTAAELGEDGVHASRWPPIETAHLKRIQDTLTVIANQN